MSIIKADTNKNKKIEFFSDFLNSFSLSPFGNDLGRVVNENAVTQSIKNLIKTNLGERLFQYNIGCNIYGSLFEFNDNITSASIILNVENTLKYYEPRCNLISITVNSITDYSIDITIIYSLINNPNPITFSTIVQRVR